MNDPSFLLLENSSIGIKESSSISKYPISLRFKDFVGDDFETRIDNYYAMDEEDNKLFRLVQSKLAAIVSFWYFSESVTKEDFDRLISDLDQK